MNFNPEELNRREKELLDILEMMDNKLDIEQSPDAEDIDGIIGYGIEVSNLSANSAKAMADAKELLLTRELIFMQSNPQWHESPTLLRKMMDGTLAVNHKYVIWSDRINAAISHKLDFLRSVVSKYKEELKLSQMQQFNQNRNT